MKETDDDYTPTTDEIRNQWTFYEGDRSEAAAQFDRWLASLTKAITTTASAQALTLAAAVGDFDEKACLELGRLAKLWVE